ncbi:hypothetical protein FQZ97_745770 [compost metagenome]
MNRTHTDSHIFSRRNAMGMAIVGSLLAPAAFSTGIAHAAAVVEIVAFSHTPVASALKPLRDWLATQGGKFKLVETDMESPAGAQRLQAVGVKGHVPIVILVNGQYQQKRADGSAVELISFPVAAGAQGWTLEDAKSAITQATTR